MASVLRDALSTQSKTSRSGKKAPRSKRGNEKSPFAGKRREAAKSIETRQRIIQATEEWLIASGYHTFSMRNIANECDMSVGNLTYHFPRKELIFNVLLDKLTVYYLEGFSRSFSEKLSQKGSGVAGLMKWLLNDAAGNRAARLNRELWMLSSHFPDIHRKLSNLYDKLIAGLVEIFSQKYPHFSHHQLKTIASLIVMITEGTCIVYGGRYRGTIPLKDMNSTVVEILTKYIETESETL
jgi:AcrR family transcriptional regulator